MKRSLLTLLTVIVISICANGQAPMRNYGEYKYSYSIDSDGDIVEKSAFPRIEPIVLTPYASYMYMVGGVWFSSPEFSWAGFQNGWYVYTYRLGPQYSYFLISRDFETIRIQENFKKGVTDVYTHCDPNEKMNNAPTY